MHLRYRLKETIWYLLTHYYDLIGLSIILLIVLAIAVLTYTSPKLPKP